MTPVKVSIEKLDPKALFQFRSQLNREIQELVPDLPVSEVVKRVDRIIGLSIQFHKRLTGEDVVIG
jgi:hypothetical protein